MSSLQTFCAAQLLRIQRTLSSATPVQTFTAARAGQPVTRGAVPRPGRPRHNAPHGTLSRYTRWGCRCDLCVERSSAYQRAYGQQRRHLSSHLTPPPPPNGGREDGRMIQCEVCGELATHACSGLDVPVLYFCRTHGESHAQAKCCGGQLVKMGSAA